MIDDEQRVVDAVRLLVGLPFFAATRAADMVCFQFGSPRTVPSALPGRPERIVGEHALHVQCAWRLRAANGDVIASGEDPVDRVAAWVEASAATVASVASDKHRRLRIALAPAGSLEVTPDDRGGEHWRLLQPGRDRPHFVVGSAGIEDD